MYLLSRDDLRRDPRWGVLAVCLVALALPLSFSAGAVAVPALAGRFQGAPSTLAWVTNAFMLSFGSLLLAAGGLADRLGRRRLFLCGSAGFALATLAVCVAADLRALDLARGVQGVAAAAALASGSAALAQRFEGHARTRVFALMGTMFGVGWRWGRCWPACCCRRWAGARCLPVVGCWRWPAGRWPCATWTRAAARRRAWTWPACFVSA